MFDEFKRDVLSKLEERIANQDRRIEQLEAELLISKTVSTLLSKTCEATEIKCDDNEQYSRRSCLRIHGIQIADDDDTENVMDIVKTCYSDVGLDFDENEIDRAHRIGQVHTDAKSNVKTRSIIVKFKSWGSRTAFYSARPKAVVNGMKKPRKFSVSLDLTKRRFELLKSAQETISHYPDISYVYADVNCSLAIRYFNDEKKLSEILKNATYVENVDV